MRLLILSVMIVLTANPAFAKAPGTHCPKDELPLEWRSCESSSDCISVYQRCISEAINKAFKKKALEWLKACGSCDASAIPREHVVCKNNQCELDPPYDSPLKIK